MSDSKNFSFNPFAMFRNIVDEQINSRFHSREELKKSSQLLVIIVGAAATFVVVKMSKNGFSLGSSWLPLTVIAILAYIVWRMHVAWVYGTIVEMASDDSDNKPKQKEAQ